MPAALGGPGAIRPVLTDAIADVAAIGIDGAFIEAVGAAGRVALRLAALAGAAVAVGGAKAVDVDAALDAGLVLHVAARVVVGAGGLVITGVG
jgi:hypothetical protein